MWFFPAYSRRPTGILKAFYRHFRSFSPSIREHIYHLTYPYSSSSCNLQFAQEQRQLYASALKAYLNDAFQHTRGKSRTSQAAPRSRHSAAERMAANTTPLSLPESYKTTMSSAAPRSLFETTMPKAEKSIISKKYLQRKYNTYRI